jgi:hypothetical protein
VGGVRNYQEKETEMGTWGTGATQSDAAFDLFGDFFGDLFGAEKIQVLRDAFRYYDDYGKIRAACHILQILGGGLFWPRKHEAALKELLDLGIKRLRDMIHPPPGKDIDFLELWAAHREEVTASVQEQIDDLTEKRKLLGR